jgi:glycosyltransferase involved in cell wall biosynthesis
VPEASIAVVIPVLDSASYLCEAIDSVLAQSVAPADVIVVDNGSRDASIEIAESYGDPVRCIRQRVPTVGPGRNEGVEVVSSELLAFVDADDLWTPRKLELQLGALHAAPAPDLVFGSVEEFVSPELEGTGEHVARPVAPAPLIAAMLVRRELFMRIGLFREDLTAVELEWIARARHAGVVEHFVPSVVLRRRVHATNNTRRPMMRQGYVNTVREVLHARRAGS